MTHSRKYERPQLIDLRINNKGSGMPGCNNGSGDEWNCTDFGSSAGFWCVSTGTAAGDNCDTGSGYA